MAKARTQRELSEKTRAVYQQVVETEDKESILEAVRHAEQVGATADSAEARRKTPDGAPAQRVGSRSLRSGWACAPRRTFPASSPESSTTPWYDGCAGVRSGASASALG